MSRKHLYEWMIPNWMLGLPEEKGINLTLEQRIVYILKTSEYDCGAWHDDVLLAVAREIVDGLEAAGWNIEHESYSSTDE